jgi:hypothetical protein
MQKTCRGLTIKQFVDNFRLGFFVGRGGEGGQWNI